jgi:hypothetical protein
MNACSPAEFLRDSAAAVGRLLPVDLLRTGHRAGFDSADLADGLRYGG